MKDETFEKWVESQMKARGWSQSELARRTGISQPHISRIIKGREINLTERTKARLVEEFERTSFMVNEQEMARRMVTVYSMIELPLALQNEDGRRLGEDTVYTMHPTSRAAFAVRVEGNQYSPRYQDGDVLVVDPRAEVQDKTLCLVREDSDYFLREYQERDGEILLSDITGRKPTLLFVKGGPLQPNIIGVVRCLHRPLG